MHENLNVWGEALLLMKNIIYHLPNWVFIACLLKCIDLKICWTSFELFSTRHNTVQTWANKIASVLFYTLLIVWCLFDPRISSITWWHKPISKHNKWYASQFRINTNIDIKILWCRFCVMTFQITDNSTFWSNSLFRPTTRNIFSSILLRVVDSPHKGSVISIFDLKCSAIWLFVQQLFQTNKNKNTKPPHCWPFLDRNPSLTSARACQFWSQISNFGELDCLFNGLLGQTTKKN